MPPPCPPDVKSLPLRPRIRHVVFDFDGTLSWLRHGWPAIMRAVMLPHLPRLPNEGAAAIEAVLQGIIIGMNGQPTILQMVRFAAVVRERGGPTHDPELLRQEYQRRLDDEIALRIGTIRERKTATDAFVVHGARRLLEKLRHDGLVLSVLSSTVEERVREEADVLGLTDFFDGRIVGCTGDPLRFSKRTVFERILRDHGLSGDQLLAFGDGASEITEAKRLGGVAIAVCSDESDNGSGINDPHKQHQLLAAGADLAIPDFRDAAILVDHLRGIA